MIIVTIFVLALIVFLQYVGLAKWIIIEYPDAILPNSEAVLTALAQNFPRELHSWEIKRGDEFVSITFQLITKPFIHQFFHLCCRIFE